MLYRAVSALFLVHTASATCSEGDIASMPDMNWPEYFSSCAATPSTLGDCLNNMDTTSECRDCVVIEVITCATSCDGTSMEFETAICSECVAAVADRIETNCYPGGETTSSAGYTPYVVSSGVVMAGVILTLL